MYSTLNETSVFWGCVYAGVLIGVLYDIASILRLPFTGRVMTGLLDGLFYAAAFCVCALALYWLNDGRLRFYSLFSILLGCFLYLRFPSRLLRTGLHAMWQRIKCGKKK